MNTLVKQGYENYIKGDHITDEQLDALIENHEEIVKRLDDLTDRKFILFRTNIFLDLESFKGFKRSREIQKTMR